MKELIRRIIREEINKDIILYHGTNATFKDFDVNKSGLIKYSDWGPGIYFTKSKSQANNYRIDAVKKFNKEYIDAFDDYEQSEKNLKKIKKGTLEYKKMDEEVFKKLKRFQQISKELNSTEEGRIIKAKINPNAKIYRYESSSGMTDPYLTKEVKSKGYDILLVDEGKYTEEYVVINPNSIEILE